MRPTGRCAIWIIWAAALVALAAPAASAPSQETIATFSCVGYDPETGDLGVIVQSKFFAVGSVVPHARANVGAIATQAFANTTYGPRGLDLLAAGKTPDEVIVALTGSDSLSGRRQIGVVDAQGRSATFTGSECMAWAGGSSGPGFAAQGNILVSEATVRGMADAFQKTPGILGDRLLAALEAGQAAGGDSRGMQSAALLIVREGAGYAGFNDRYCDLRVDDAVDPIAELRRIYELWKPSALVTEGYRLVEQGAFDRAYAMGREAISLRPQDGELRYHLACYHARGGMCEEAFNLLSEALRMRPSLAEQARSDPDFASLRDDPRFESLIEEAARD